MTSYLSVQEVIVINTETVRRFGGTHGIRDAGALEAAVGRPQTGYYKDIVEEAAALFESLSQNHPFIDGNKRTAGMAMFTFLQLNGLEPIASEADYYVTMMAVASGQMSKEELAAWVQTVVRGAPPDVTTE